jgi:hypothetical protein
MVGWLPASKKFMVSEEKKTKNHKPKEKPTRSQASFLHRSEKFRQTDPL